MTGGARHGPSQLSLKLSFRPAQAREDFVVASCNELAVSWVDRWPDWPGGGLILHGPQGCGKTHLAAVWQAQCDAVTLNDGALDLETGRKLAETGDALLLEDVDARLSAVPAWEETLLHLYNAAHAAGGSLLMTAAGHPADWRLSLPDLRSRVNALPAARIDMPDDALLESVMRKRFGDRQMAIQPDLLRYVLPRIERSFSAIHEFVDRIDRVALARRRKVNRALAIELLKTQDRTGLTEGDRNGSGT